MSTADRSGVRIHGPRRAAAVVALAALLTAAAFLAVAALHRLPVLLLSVASLAIAVVAAWYVVSRRGVVRALGAVVGIVALAGFVVVMVITGSALVLIAGLALAALSVSAAGYALQPTRRAAAVEAAPSARQPVLLLNPRSGGGKAERFALADRCRELGIEPVVLVPGDDLLALAEDAVERGADLLGMAGGDGSQALVASVASRHGIPFVVVPAGTRNHFARDLGIDRTDVRGALQAYIDGVDTTIDLADVNGRVFVNNAAMGVYAAIVQSADYRDAKVQTAASMLPDLIGPTAAAPPPLYYRRRSGEEATAGQLLLISNNPYQLRHLRGGGARAHLDSGLLGVVSIAVSTAADLEAFTALEFSGRVSQFQGWEDWTAAEVSVRSPEPVELGVDGEALVLEPPLRFTVRPAALTVRLPRAAVPGSAAARTVRLTRSGTVEALWQIALGRPGAT